MVMVDSQGDISSAAADRGWICPRCDAVNAPSVAKCACSPKAAAATPGTVQDVLDELKRLAKSLPPYGYPPYTPPYHPWRTQPLYPYWWGNGVVYGNQSLSNQQNMQMQNTSNLLLQDGGQTSSGGQL